MNAHGSPPRSHTEISNEYRNAYAMLLSFGTRDPCRNRRVNTGSRNRVASSGAVLCIFTSKPFALAMKPLTYFEISKGNSNIMFRNFVCRAGASINVLHSRVCLFRSIPLKNDPTCLNHCHTGAIEITMSGKIVRIQTILFKRRA